MAGNAFKGGFSGSETLGFYSIPFSIISGSFFFLSRIFGGIFE